MSGHDAASVVSQMAGLGESGSRGVVTPEQLIAAFCLTDRDAQAKGATVSQGFCGYNGGRGDDLATGFDDGYAFMGFLSDHGWRMLPSKGDWPYLVYLFWRPQDSTDPWAIVEYCEGDLTVWRFETIDAAKALYAGLKDCP